MSKMKESEFQRQLALSRSSKEYRKKWNRDIPSKRQSKKPAFNAFRPIRYNVKLEALFVDKTRIEMIPVYVK